MSGLWEVLVRHFPQFLSGFVVTIQLVAAAFVVAVVLGVVVAGLRVQPLPPLRLAGTIYVEFFRNIPLLVLLFIAFAGLRRAGLDISRFAAGAGSLGLYTAAYVAEAIRSGVFAVGQGQIDAALSLGFTYPRTLRMIVQPLPPLRLAGTIYVEFFRNIPLLVLLFIAFAGLRRAGLDISRFAAGAGSLGLYTAAYVA